MNNVSLVCTMFVGFFVYLMLFKCLLHAMYPHIPIMFDGKSPGIDLRTFVESIVFTALWEEMAFRVAPIKIATIINPKLIWPVIFISSIIFGYGHGGLHGLMFQGVMGLGFSYVYMKTNYISAVVLHAMWNTFCFLML
jgi:membrane protease YdiL (CAAX protease family)